jgi:uncharacterized membrane protein YedE/YeeE
VLGGAVGVTLATFRFVLKLKKPVLADHFVITKETHIDRPLVIGAILFGVGWGISGYCPGPAVALIASPNWELLAFLPAAIVGALTEKYFVSRSQKQAESQSIQLAQTNVQFVESPPEGSCG